MCTLLKRKSSEIVTLVTFPHVHIICPFCELAHAILYMLWGNQPLLLGIPLFLEDGKSSWALDNITRSKYSRSIFYPWTTYRGGSGLTKLVGLASNWGIFQTTNRIKNNVSVFRILLFKQPIASIDTKAHLIFHIFSRKQFFLNVSPTTCFNILKIYYPYIHEFCLKTVTILHFISIHVYHKSIKLSFVR